MVKEKSNLVAHAERELNAIGLSEKAGDMDRAMYRDIMNIVRLFARQGHSGFSASYTANMLDKLLRFEPIAPLTGEDSEWVDQGFVLQNNRCSHVFKDPDTGETYDSEGIVFSRGKGGVPFTNGKSRVPVTFPYTPSHKHVTIPRWQFWR